MCGLPLEALCCVGTAGIKCQAVVEVSAAAEGVPPSRL